MPEVTRMPALVATLCVAVCSLGCASQIFLRPKHTRTTAEPLHLAAHSRRAEPVALTNGGGREIGALLFAAPGDHGTLMVSGGNGMGRKHTYGYTKFLQRRGFRVLVFSFQGYDTNGGDAELGSLLQDAVTVHDELLRRYPGEPIAYLASSISTAPALCLPSQEPELAGVVLEGAVNLNTIPFVKFRELWQLWPLAPFTLSYAAFVSASVPWELNGRRCARNAGTVPALFLHHPDDRMTPYGSARSLYDAYAGPKHFESFRASRNPQHHLLLRRDRDAQALVLSAVSGWLRPPD